MAKVKYRKISKELLQMSAPKEEEGTRSSINSSFEVAEHYKIDIDKLIPYKKQARKKFNDKDLEGLSLSIKEHGIRQPLTVIHSTSERGKYEVVSGERRLKAAKLIKLSKVPCIIISDEYAAEEIALAENIQRENLHPIELGEAFTNILSTRVNLSQRELAEKLGISEKLISDNIQYTKLPEKVKNLLIEKNITNRDTLRKFTKLEDPLKFIDDKENLINMETILSVLRISFKNGEFKVQNNAIEKLDIDKKQDLKKILQNLIIDIH